jgi:hypothetical protein
VKIFLKHLLVLRDQKTIMVGDAKVQIHCRGTISAFAVSAPCSEVMIAKTASATSSAIISGCYNGRACNGK